MRDDESRPDQTRPDFSGLSAWTARCGAQLVRAYGQLGLEQRGFADRVGVDARQVRRWERAEAAPGARQRARMLAVLGGPASALWADPMLALLGGALGALLPGPPSAAEAADPQQPAALPPASGTRTPRHPFSSRAIVFTGLAGVVGVCLLGVLLWWLGARPSDRLVAVEPSAAGPWRFRYASGRVFSIVMQPRNGYFSWNTGDRAVECVRVADLDGDGDLDAVVVSIDAAPPHSATGELRIDLFASDAQHVRTAWLDDRPAYGDTLLAGNAWSLEAVRFLDWDGDAATLETLVVATHTWFPSLLVIINAEAERIRTYVHAGHIKDVVPVHAEFVESVRMSQARVVASTSTAGARGVALALSVEYNEPPRSEGLVLLPAGFVSGACPALTARYRHAQLPLLQQARYVKLLPSLVAQACPAGHNWPEALAYDAATRTLQLTTLEEPGGDGVLRTLDATLRQTAVLPMGRFRHEYPKLQQQHGIPALDSDAVAVSFETRAVWQMDRWVTVRDTGAWHP